MPKKKTDKQFRDGWRDLMGQQRSERARYIVEEGIDDGRGIRDVARELGITQKDVQEMIDFYWVERGGVATAVATPMKATRDGLRHAIRQYEVDPEEVAEVAEELVAEHGYSDDVAKRAARASIVGETLRREKKFTKDNELTIKDPRFFDEDGQKIRDRVRAAAAAEKYGVPVNYEKWRKQFGQMATDVTRFLSFLRRTKPALMQDPTIVRRLTLFAESFDQQAERFEAGVAKHTSKSK